MNNIVLQLNFMVVLLTIKVKANFSLQYILMFLCKVYMKIWHFITYYFVMHMIYKN